MTQEVEAGQAVGGIKQGTSHGRREMGLMNKLQQFSVSCGSPLTPDGRP